MTNKMILCCSDLRDADNHHHQGRHVAGCPLSVRNGSVPYRGFTVFRGGMGEYLLCRSSSGEDCFQVARSEAEAKNTLDEMADGKLY